MIPSKSRDPFTETFPETSSTTNGMPGVSKLYLRTLSSALSVSLGQNGPASKSRPTTCVTILPRLEFSGTLSTSSSGKNGVLSFSSHTMTQRGKMELSMISIPTSAVVMWTLKLWLPSRSSLLSAVRTPVCGCKEKKP